MDRSVGVAARLPRCLTLEQAAPELTRLRTELKQHSGEAAVIDASELDECDSSAVAVLLELRREQLGQGRSLAIKDSPQRLQDLVALYGVQELLPQA